MISVPQFQGWGRVEGSYVNVGTSPNEVEFCTFLLPQKSLSPHGLRQRKVMIFPDKAEALWLPLPHTEDLLLAGLYQSMESILGINRCLLNQGYSMGVQEWHITIHNYRDIGVEGWIDRSCLLWRMTVRGFSDRYFPDLSSRSRLSNYPDLRLRSRLSNFPHLRSRSRLLNFPDLGHVPDCLTIPTSDHVPNSLTIPTSDHVPDCPTFPTSDHVPDCPPNPTSDHIPDCTTFPTSGHVPDSLTIPTSDHIPDCPNFPDLRSRSRLSIYPDLRSHSRLSTYPGLRSRSRLSTYPDLRSRARLSTYPDLRLRSRLSNFRHLRSRSRLSNLPDLRSRSRCPNFFDVGKVPIGNDLGHQCGLRCPHTIGEKVPQAQITTYNFNCKYLAGRRTSVSKHPERSFLHGGPRYDASVPRGGRHINYITRF
ncbi:hypothetical protein J6590_035107, partial [Homalodisca vitripennis]